MRILIVKIGAAGDVLRTTALLPGIRRKYPKSQIHWLTETQNRDILSGNPYLEQVLCIDALPPSIRRQQYDLVISTDEEPDVCHLVSEIKKKKLIGTYLDSDTVRYTDDSAPRFDMSRISALGPVIADRLKKKNRSTYQETYARMIGTSFQGERPQLFITPNERIFAGQFAQAHGIQGTDEVIGINTGSGGRWPTKRLSIPDTVRLIKLIHKIKPKAKVLLLGGPSEAVRNSEVHSKMPRVINPGCHHPMKRFAALLDLCSAVVTSDSFALHVATALGKRVVAFFGPTSPWEIELYGNGEKILPITGCVGCFKPTCKVPITFDIQSIANAI